MGRGEATLIYQCSEAELFTGMLRSYDNGTMMNFEDLAVKYLARSGDRREQTNVFCHPERSEGSYQ